MYYIIEGYELLYQGPLVSMCNREVPLQLPGYTMMLYCMFSQTKIHCSDVRTADSVE